MSPSDPLDPFTEALRHDLPILPVDYTLDIAAAKIPEGKANGRISGTNFVVETARLDLGPTSQPLRLR